MTSQPAEIPAAYRGDGKSATAALGGLPGFAALRAAMPINDDLPLAALTPASNKDTRTMTDSNPTPAAPKAILPRKRRGDGAADTRSAIKRLLDGKAGTQVEVDGHIVRVDLEDGKRGDKLRKFTILYGELAGVYVWAFEVLDCSLLAYKPGASTDLYDKATVLHGLLRGLALEECLAKEDARPQRDEQAEARTLAKLSTGTISLNPPAARPAKGSTLVMEHTHAPDSMYLPDVAVRKNYRGIEGLFEAPRGKTVALGEFTFRVDTVTDDNGAFKRRYEVILAPKPHYVGIWIGHWELEYRSPRITEKMNDQLSEVKIELHALLRNAAVDAGLLAGGYAHVHRLISDQAAVRASIRDEVVGLYELHSEYGESARLLIEDNVHGRKTLILLGGKGDWFNDTPPVGLSEDPVEIRPGVRFDAHWVSAKNKKHLPNRNWDHVKQAHLIQLWNWVTEAVYYN